MIATEEQLLYLDSLRESGVTNMFGAAAYVREEFSVSRQESMDILKEWMKTFAERHPQ